MKDSFRRAKKKAERKKCSPWYIFEKGGWKCLFFLVLLIPFAKLSERIKTKKYNNLVRSEEKAKKVLDKTLPKVLAYDTKNDEYYFGTNWNVRALLVKHAPIRWRKWTDKFPSSLCKYLKDTYENKDYIKTIEEDFEGSWIIFKEKA